MDAPKKVLQTPVFKKQLDGLKDVAARVRIYTRINKIRDVGHFGVSKSLGGGINELIFVFGSGYRVYYAVNKDVVLLLLGDKSTQRKDIQKARELWLEFDE